MNLNLSCFTLSQEIRHNWQCCQRFRVKVCPTVIPDFEIRGMLAEEVSLLLNEELTWTPDCEAAEASYGRSLDWHLVCPGDWFQGVTFERPSKTD